MFNFHVQEGFLLAADGLVVWEANESYVLNFVGDSPFHKLITKTISLLALLGRLGLEYVLFERLQSGRSTGHHLHDALSKKICHKRNK